MPRKNPGWQKFRGSYGTYAVKKEGTVWWMRSPDGGKYPYATREAAIRAIPKKPAKNPRGQLLFSSRAAAVKYAREHGAKRYSIRKLRTAK